MREISAEQRHIRERFEGVIGHLAEIGEGATTRAISISGRVMPGFLFGLGLIDRGARPSGVMARRSKGIAALAAHA